MLVRFPTSLYFQMFAYTSLLLVLILALGAWLPLSALAIPGEPEGAKRGSDDLPPGWKWKSYEEMHSHYTHNFVESEGMGIRRIVTFDEPRNRMLAIDGANYTVSELRLLGLSEETPKVYESSWVGMTRNALARYETRKLNAFEKEALVQLENGMQLVRRENKPLRTKLVSTEKTKSGRPLQSQPKRIPQEKTYTLVGALRADESCMECHNAKRNELLGAFVYTMKKSDREQPKGLESALSEAVILNKLSQSPKLKR